MWQIELSEEAFRNLSNLETAVAKRIVKKLEDAANDPNHYFTRLVGYDDFKLRVGDYRILVLLSHEKKLIFVQQIGHKRNIYKN